MGMGVAGILIINSYEMDHSLIPYVNSISKSSQPHPDFPGLGIDGRQLLPSQGHLSLGRGCEADAPRRPVKGRVVLAQGGLLGIFQWKLGMEIGDGPGWNRFYPILTRAKHDDLGFDPVEPRPQWIFIVPIEPRDLGMDIGLPPHDNLGH